MPSLLVILHREGQYHYRTLCKFSKPIHNRNGCSGRTWFHFVRFEFKILHRPLARYVNCGGMPERFPRHRLQRKPLVSDPGMQHSTCVTHVPCCMPGSLTRGGGENVPGIPGAYATRNFTYLARDPLHKVPGTEANNVNAWPRFRRHFSVV